MALRCGLSERFDPDIANQVIVAIGLGSDRPYQRGQDGSDDRVQFTYRVLPPRPEA